MAYADALSIARKNRENIKISNMQKSLNNTIGNNKVTVWNCEEEYEVKKYRTWVQGELNPIFKY